MIRLIDAPNSSDCDESNSWDSASTILPGSRAFMLHAQPGSAPPYARARRNRDPEAHRLANIEVPSSEIAARYMQTKKEKMGHLLDLEAR